METDEGEQGEQGGQGACFEVTSQEGSSFKK